MMGGGQPSVPWLKREGAFSKAPAHQEVSLKPGSTPQRHALHNLSGEERRGPRAQAVAGPESLFSRFSRPQDTAAGVEQRGTVRAGKPRRRVGRPRRADRGGALTRSEEGAGRDWTEPHHPARRRLLSGRTADSSPPAAWVFSYKLGRQTRRRS